MSRNKKNNNNQERYVYIEAIPKETADLWKLLENARSDSLFPMNVSTLVLYSLCTPAGVCCTLRRGRYCQLMDLDERLCALQMNESSQRHMNLL